MHQKIQRISVKGIIYKDDSIFMLKDAKGNWELPGGRLDFGEHLADALRREFKEELAVTNFEIGRLVDVWDFSGVGDDYDYHIILVVYECKADLDNIVISDEHTEHAWIASSALADYHMRDGYRQAIETYLKML